MQAACMGIALLVAVLVAGASLLPAPGGARLLQAAGPEPMTASAAPQQINLRVGMLPVSAYLGYYYARDEGYFAEEGLGLDAQVMAGAAEIIPAMIGGSLDVGIANVFSHILARDRGFDVRAIAAAAAERRGEPTHAIMVQGNSPIQSARDLEGRTFAINTLNNIDHLMVQIWIQNNGGDPRRVNFTEMPFPQQPAALVQVRVEAAGPTEPFVTAAQEQGARVLAYHYTDTNPSTLLGYYVAAGDWLGRNQDAARRFARAVHRANAALEANGDLKRAAAQRSLNIAPDLASRMQFEEMQTRIDPAAIDWWIDAGRRFGLVEGQLNPHDFLTDLVR